MSTPAVHHDFPANPTNHNHLATAVLQWAEQNAIQVRPPEARQDTYRTVLDLAAQHIDVASIRWRAFATHILSEYVEDTAGEQPAVKDREQLQRLVALYGAVRVLAALTVALTAPLDDARWGFVGAVMRYTAGVLRGWGMTARRPT